MRPRQNELKMTARARKVGVILASVTGRYVKSYRQLERLNSKWHSLKRTNGQTSTLNDILRSGE